MRIYLTLLFGLLMPITAQAQQDSVQAIPWQKSLVFGISGAQTGYQNWKKGGVSSVALTSSLDGTFKRATPTWRVSHTIHLVLGTVQQDTLDFRKSDDQIRYQGSLEFKGTKAFRPTISLGVETQFLPGFNYKKNPFGDQRPLPVKVSDVFSPAYFTQGLGVTYVPKWLSVRFGLGAKETVVLIERLRSLYGVRPTRPIRFELGVESRVEFERDVATNVHWKSSAAFFAAFNKPELPDAVWRNEIRMRINSWLTTRIEAEMLYDRDLSRKVQLREVLALSVVFHLL